MIQGAISNHATIHQCCSPTAPQHTDVLLPTSQEADVYTPPPFVLIYLISCSVTCESTMYRTSSMDSSSDSPDWRLSLPSLGLATPLVSVPVPTASSR